MAGAVSSHVPSPAVVIVDDSQNWLRINLIAESCLTDILLTVLHNKNNDPNYIGLPENGVDLWNRMQAFRRKFENQLKKVIREEQWNVICPSSGVSNSSKWDITTLKVVAQYEVLHSQPPMAGWENDPIPIDKSLAADVCRARNIRNFVKHSTMKAFSDATVCNNTLTKIITLLQRLGYKNIGLFNDLASGSLKLYDDVILKVLQQKVNHTSDQVKTLEDTKCETTKESKTRDQIIRKNKVEIESLQQEVNGIKICINDVTNLIDQRHKDIQQLLQHTDEIQRKLNESIMVKVEANKARIETNEARTETNEVRIETNEKLLRNYQKDINPDEVVLPICLEIVAEHIGDQWQLLAHKLQLPMEETSREHTPQVNIMKCFENVHSMITWAKLKKCLEQMEQDTLLKRLKDETNLTYGLLQAITQLRVKNQSMESTSSDCHIYIDLAVVPETEYNDNYTEYENYINHMSATRETISLDKVVQFNDNFVLVTGNAGIGKSELTMKLISKWEKGDLFNGENGMPKIDLLFFIKCRELNAVDFLSIDTHESILMRIFPEVFKRVTMDELNDVCHKMMLIVDGLDELMSIEQLDRPATIRDLRVQKMVQFVRDVLFSNSTSFRPKYRVAVGRPYITTFMKKFTRRRESKVVYVCGFNSASVNQYIKTYCDEKLQQKVKTELELSQNLSAMSHVPVYLSVICSIYKEELNISTPRTVTELMMYACLVFIRRHLIDNEENDVESLRELCDRKDVMKLIKSISWMSFKSLYEKTILFGNEDLKEIIHDISELEKKTGFVVKSSNEEFGSLYQFSHLVLQELFCGFYMYFTPKEKLDFICKGSHESLSISLVIDGQEKLATHLNNCFAVVACVEGIHQRRDNSLLSHFVKQLADVYHLSFLTNKSLMENIHRAIIVPQATRNRINRILYMRCVHESYCEIPSTVKHQIELEGNEEIRIRDILELRLNIHFYKKLGGNKISFRYFDAICSIENLRKEEIEGLAYLLSKSDLHAYDARYKPIYEAILQDLEMQRLKLKAILLIPQVNNIAEETPLLTILPYVESLSISPVINVIKTISEQYMSSKYQFKHLDVLVSEDVDVTDEIGDIIVHLTTLTLRGERISRISAILNKVKNLKECGKLSLRKFIGTIPLDSDLIINDINVFVNFARYIPCVNLQIINNEDEDAIIQSLRNVKTSFDHVIKQNDSQQHVELASKLEITICKYTDMSQNVNNQVQIINSMFNSAFKSLDVSFRVK